MDRNRFLGLFDKKDVVKENIAKRDEIAKGANGDSTVATVQASLAMLGYDLGKYGVDGKQGEVVSRILHTFQRDLMHMRFSLLLTPPVLKLIDLYSYIA